MWLTCYWIYIISTIKYQKVGQRSDTSLWHVCNAILLSFKSHSDHCTHRMQLPKCGKGMTFKEIWCPKQSVAIWDRMKCYACQLNLGNWRSNFYERHCSSHRNIFFSIKVLLSENFLDFWVFAYIIYNVYYVYLPRGFQRK